MFEQWCLTLRHVGTIAVLTGALVCTGKVSAKSDEPSDSKAIGRINFDQASLPPANVELDLSQGMFTDLFGIGDAAVAGVAETLLKANKGEHVETSRLAAEQLAAARQIIGLSAKVVKEVRIRAFEKFETDLSPHFEKQLRDGEWEKAVVLHKDKENARVYLIRQNESIRGAFVVAGNHEGQVLVNVVCDISPDNVKSLTSAATKIGIDNGLLKRLETKFRHINGPMPPAPPKPPAPPRAAEPPKSEAA